MNCVRCGNRAYSQYCFRCKPRKRIPQKGKKAEEWDEVRQDWIDRNGTDHNCYMCGVQLNQFTLTLDHVIPRSNFKNYSNRHNDDNLRPCCWNCNSEKGSKHDQSN